MTKKELKLMAGEIIKESEYSNSAKKQLLNFVLSEADETQLKALILDGKMITELEEDAVAVINDRFYSAMEKANKDRIEEMKEFIEIGKEGLCKIIESDCGDMDKFEDMINFIINEASDYQILSMIFEGIVPEETINEQKEASYYDLINEIKYPRVTGAAIGGAMGAGAAAAGGAIGASAPLATAGATGLIIYGAYATYKALMKRLGKQCERIKDPEDHADCLKNAKNNAIKQQMRILKSGMNKCKKSKDPVKCSETIKKKIVELQTKLK